MKQICMYVDESGSGNPKTGMSSCYIVCGCTILDYKRDEIKIKADQIKFKYWGTTDIVFHSNELGRKSGPFSILRDSSIEMAFYKDLFKFLSLSQFFLLIALVDHAQAKKQNWNEQKVYKETADIIIKNFILTLLAQGDVKGKLIIESATAEKDFIYHKVAGHYLSNGIKDLKVSYKDVQNVLTEISFVTKKNNDIEEQIADLLAYGAKLKFQKLKQADMSEYQRGISKIMNKKLFIMHPATGIKKKKYQEKIDSFKKVP